MAGKALSNIKIHFISLDKNIVRNVTKVFAGDDMFDNITVERGNILKCDAFDCIVSPANSGGQMDGGIDAALNVLLRKTYDTDYIGRKVRTLIAEEYYGEQPIGTCLLLPTENDKYPFLAHAPTMTIPKNVVGTLNAYYAFKAVLSSVVNYNKTAHKGKRIKSILTTTFCTGCGDVPFETALKQMRYAYNVVHDGIDPDWGALGKLVMDLEDLKK